MKDLANRESVEQHSEQWVSLKTRAAAAGDVDACSELGPFWLRKSGWYPYTGRRDEEIGRIALSRFLLVANLSAHNGDDIATRYTIVALVLRENGFDSEGLQWLQYGMDTIKETCTDTPNMKKRSIERLADVKETWNLKSSKVKIVQWLHTSLRVPELPTK